MNFNWAKFGQLQLSTKSRKAELMQAPILPRDTAFSAWVFPTRLPQNLAEYFKVRRSWRDTKCLSYKFYRH
jgi:hypothetical protein